MSKLLSYKDESVVDLAIRGYGSVEAMLNLAIDNELAIDDVEAFETERMVDDLRKAELTQQRTKFAEEVILVNDKLVSYKDESTVDMVVRGYGNIEALVKFMNDNQVAADAEETASLNRLIDQALKDSLAKEDRFFFSIESTEQLTVKGNSDDSMIDLVIKGYGNVEGLIRFALDNEVAIDDIETGATERLVDSFLKQELISERPMMIVPTDAIKNVIVQSDQNVVDLTIQESGDIEGFVDFLKANGFIPNTDPEALTILKPSEVVDSSVAEFFLKRKVNTGLVEVTTIDNARILEDGSFRLLEDDSYRLLE